MRAMPSPAEMIVPSSETSTPPLNPSICCLRTLVISSALIAAMPHSPPNRPSMRPDELLAQGLEVVPQGAVVDPGADPRARSPQKAWLDLLGEPHRAPGHFFQRLAQPLQIGRRQRHRGGRLRGHNL